MPETKIRITIDRARRFTLDSHSLIKRTNQDLVAVVDQICGLNSQTARASYISLWSRIKGFKRSVFDKVLYKDRKLIKTWLMRGTVHTVPAKDFAIYQKALRRNLNDNWEKSLERHGLMPLNKKREKLDQEIVKVLATGSFTKKELLAKVKHLLKSYADKEQRIILSRSLRTLAYQGLICHGEPTGTWYHFKENRFTAIENWCPGIDLDKMDEDKAQRMLLIKYLKGYGPATINDFAYWSGLSVTESKEILDRTKKELTMVEVMDQRADFWIYKGDANRLKVKKRKKIGTRFLPEFDPLVMGHKNKARILDDKYRKKIFLPLADVAPVIIAGGQIVSTWNYRFSDRSLRISLFEKSDKKIMNEIDKEAVDLKKFLSAA